MWVWQCFIHTLYLCPFTLEEMQKGLDSLQNSKAAGFDGMHSELLKNCGSATNVGLLPFFSSTLY